MFVDAAPQVNSPSSISGSSMSLEDLIKDGKQDIKEGKDLLEKVGTGKGKRTREDANTPGKAEPPRVFVSQDNPIHILEQLPASISKGLMKMPENERLNALNFYLNRQLHRVPNTLHKEIVCKQKTQLEKFEQLVKYLAVAGLELENLKAMHDT